MSIVMRPITEEDVISADPLLIEAYNANRSFQDQLELYMSLQPDGWFFALDDTTPVGMGGVVNYGPFAYIGLIAVAPSVQRRGIGRLIMEYLLGRLAEQGCPSARLVATRSGAGLYSKMGFIADDTTIAYRLEDTARIASTQGSEPVSVLGTEDLDALVAFDSPLFGADRRRLLAALLADQPGRCMATRDQDGNITGYIVATQDALGPWMARTPAQAEALLAQALALPFEEPPAVRANTSHRAAIQLLTTYGFGERRVFTHMYHGSKEPLPHKEQLYALASSALG